MKFLFLIVPRSSSKKVSEIISRKRIDFQITVPAIGTAPMEILEYFSIGETERDMIFSIIDDNDIESIFNELESEYGFLKSGHGVAFAVDLDGATKLGYQYLYHQLESIGGK
ncbi:MAG TPA: hypothetical protein P5154_02260 [Candidatus Izemoplasmatales bacterium]|nr:hypothetical protein [Candidatus Izemoplasmatales bacterium]